MCKYHAPVSYYFGGGRKLCLLECIGASFPKDHEKQRIIYLLFLVVSKADQLNSVGNKIYQRDHPVQLLLKRAIFKIRWIDVLWGFVRNLYLDLANADALSFSFCIFYRFCTLWAMRLYRCVSLRVHRSI